MRDNLFTSDFRRVKMANSRVLRMAKVYDKKSIYCHCVSLKKLLSQEEQALMQPFEDSLRQQDKLRPPYGECHHCHDRGHWIRDCPEAQKLREQQMSTDKKVIKKAKIRNRYNQVPHMTQDTNGKVTN